MPQRSQPRVHAQLSGHLLTLHLEYPEASNSAVDMPRTGYDCTGIPPDAPGGQVAGRARDKRPGGSTPRAGTPDNQPDTASEDMDITPRAARQPTKDSEHQARTSTRSNEPPSCPESRSFHEHHRGIPGLVFESPATSRFEQASRQLNSPAAYISPRPTRSHRRRTIVPDPWTGTFPLSIPTALRSPVPTARRSPASARQAFSTGPPVQPMTPRIAERVPAGAESPVRSSYPSPPTAANDGGPYWRFPAPVPQWRPSEAEQDTEMGNYPGQH
ncbi:hypothetical protein G7046_g5851 [Stylonectria norvegica]|nr:hypothetical protein G7046_g5851 [Stylonectria norvegica]